MQVGCKQAPGTDGCGLIARHDRNLQCNGAKLQDRKCEQRPLSGSVLAAPDGGGFLINRRPALSLSTRHGSFENPDGIYARCM